MMFEDPIVKEVREIRERHAARFGYDLRKIFEDLKKKEKELNLPVVSLPPRQINSDKSKNHS